MFNQAENGVICHFFGHTEITGVVHRDYLLDIDGMEHTSGDKLEPRDDSYVVTINGEEHEFAPRSFASLVTALEKFTSREI